jgi:hypothetical protein
MLIVAATPFVPSNLSVALEISRDQPGEFMHQNRAYSLTSSAEGLPVDIREEMRLLAKTSGSTSLKKKFVASRRRTRPEERLIFR